MGGCCLRAAERSDSGATSERMRPVGRPTATGARRWSGAERRAAFRVLLWAYEPGVTSPPSVISEVSKSIV